MLGVLLIISEGFSRLLCILEWYLLARLEWWSWIELRSDLTLLTILSLRNRLFFQPHQLSFQFLYFWPPLALGQSWFLLTAISTIFCYLCTAHARLALICLAIHEQCLVIGILEGKKLLRNLISFYLSWLESRVILLHHLVIAFSINLLLTRIYRIGLQLYACFLTLRWGIREPWESH
jgi:hypothetical protein